MLKQISFIDLIKSIQTMVEKNTKLKCYDDIPKSAKSPLFFVEIVGTRPDHSKTMFMDVFTVWFHAIAKPSKSSVGVYKLVQDLEEALTEDIDLPIGFDLILQKNNGVKTIKLDETDEKHAVVEYEFKIAYGFKCK